ncbi:hypothetical protein HMPREF1619_05265 [Klebsiella pneumoniae 909957]|nr:hypothetical protein HMPREF1619_05265 [Klebsiella pneumoniae 909957]
MNGLDFCLYFKRLNLHLSPAPIIRTLTFLPCSGSIKSQTSLMQITTYRT